jgi:hypothetical protein
LVFDWTVFGCSRSPSFWLDPKRSKKIKNIQSASPHGLRSPVDVRADARWEVGCEGDVGSVQVEKYAVRDFPKGIADPDNADL